jgi:hypothetical protein
MSLSEFRNVSTFTSQKVLSAHKLRKRRTKVIGGSDVIVMMDGKIYNNNNNNNNSALIKMTDPKTLHIDLFIPPGDHTLQIKGIKSAT